MIEIANATLGYGRTPVSTDLNFTVPENSFTMIVGPNGCGKSTVLRALSRLLSPHTGAVILEGEDIRRIKTKQLARRLGLLTQHPASPDGIRVAELVARGRHPHLRVLQQWTAADEKAVADAMRITGVTELAAHPVDQLSGGQRQRVWIALVLAQQTPLLLLDEPTTFLDLAHQLSILELCRKLVAEQGRTIVAVVHDLSQACRFATHMIAMRDGAVVASGAPAEIVTPSLVRGVFGVEAMIIDDPVTGTPLVVPLVDVPPVNASLVTRPLGTREEEAPA